MLNTERDRTMLNAALDRSMLNTVNDRPVLNTVNDRTVLNKLNNRTLLNTIHCFGWITGTLVSSENYTWNTADSLGRGASAIVYLGRHKVGFHFSSLCLCSVEPRGNNIMIIS